LNIINDFNLVINSYPFIGFLIVGFFGLFMGSFLNVLVNRMIIMENNYLAGIAKDLSEKVTDDVSVFLSKYSGYTLFKPDSSCPNCGHKIKFYENIPILSYIFLRGKCSSCKDKISVQYPLIEFISTILFLSSYYFYGFSYEFVTHSILLYMLFALSISDVKSRLIFDSYLLIIFVTGFFNSSITGYESAFDGFTLSVLVYFGLFCFISIFEALFKNGDISFGRGDIKLIGVLSIWFTSLMDVMMMLIASCLFGFLYILIASLLKKIKVGDYVPFGPSIAIGFLVEYYFNISSFII